MSFRLQPKIASPNGEATVNVFVGQCTRVARPLSSNGGAIADLVFAHRAGRPEPVAELPLPEELRRVPRRLLVAVPVVLAVAAVVIYQLNLVLAYNDSRAHLLIARRTFDSLVPGFAQLGTVWLPLPHLLLLPLVQVDFLYQSGLAGTMVGLAISAYGAFSIYRLVSLWTGRRSSALLTLAVYVLNPNLLYIQATPLTEPVFVGLFAGSAYHLAAWMRTLSYRDLILAATLAAASSLARYDGWAVAAAGSVVALTFTFAQTRRRDAAEAMGLSFAALACFGMLLWVFYNYTIFGDALAFQHGAYSAGGQQALLVAKGGLPAQGHPAVAAQVYGWAVLDVVGPLVLALGIVGWGLELSRLGSRLRTGGLFVMLAAPCAFQLLTLYLGQTVIYIPQMDPVGFFNNRFGLLALPVVAVGCGLLAARGRRTQVAVALVAALQLGIFAVSGPPILVQDGTVGVSAALPADPAADYLRAHYGGGRILVDDSQDGAVLIFDSRLPAREFVVSGDQRFWARAIDNPAGQVRYIYVRPGDLVSAQMTPEKLSSFRLIGTKGPFSVYEAA